MKKWTEKEKAYLLEAKQAGKTFAEIAKKLNRNHRSVEHKFYRLKALSRGDEIKQIIRDIESGATYLDIIKKHKISSAELSELFSYAYKPPKAFLETKLKCKKCGAMVSTKSLKFPDYCSLKCWALDDK